ncbi:MAG: helix-turn-helix domain-containing protein [Candidatus Aminicenantes bacterium]|nr:helix-turn-helix domain-containing protein [Candidatus Aminicenantes bacterium]
MSGGESAEPGTGNLFFGRLKKIKRQLTKVDKTGTKKSYISRLENGKIDAQLSTLFKIFEEGLGRKLNLTIS